MGAAARRLSCLRVAERPASRHHCVAAATLAVSGFEALYEAFGPAPASRGRGPRRRPACSVIPPKCSARKGLRGCSAIRARPRSASRRVTSRHADRAQEDWRSVPAELRDCAYWRSGERVSGDRSSGSPRSTGCSGSVRGVAAAAQPRFTRAGRGPGRRPAPGGDRQPTRGPNGVGWRRIREPGSGRRDCARVRPVHGLTD